METFLVRLWPPDPAGDSAPSDLRGVVERPGTPEAYPFRGDRELLTTLRTQLEGALEPTRTYSPEGSRP